MPRGSFIHLEVDTFAPFSAHASDVSQWIDRTRREVVVPLLTDENGQVVEWPPQRVGFHDFTPRGPTGALISSIAGSRLASSNPGLRLPTARSWSRLRRDFETGRVENLEYSVMRLDESAHPTLVAHLYADDVHGMGRASIARRLVLTLGPEEITGLRQGSLVDAFLRAATVVPVATGVLGGVDGRTYEDRIGRSIDDALRACDRLVRGVYWGMLLSGGHLEQLNGRKSVLRDAPVFEARDLSNHRADLVYLQLTESLTRITPTQFAAYERYLAPVLPVALPGWIDLGAFLESTYGPE